MKKILTQLIQHETLDYETAKQILVNITENKYNEAQVAAFMTVYLMRNITLEELSGFRSALLELCLPLNIGDTDSIDLCGTGGDSKNTFNISTLASFVVAGAGYRVVKHGNYGVSSVSGSSNVMEYFGYQFTNQSATLNRQLDELNICFLHAPLFHPALKAVAPIRKALQVKTFFNMLGPMINPARPNHQMVGVFNLNLARLYANIYQKTNMNYAIVHSSDGYDEFSLTSACKVISPKGEQLLLPENIGFDRLQQSDLFGGDTVEEAAIIFKNILEGNGTKAQNQVVLANAALAIQCFHQDKALSECVLIAKESLESKKAHAVFTSLINMK